MTGPKSVTQLDHDLAVTHPVDVGDVEDVILTQPHHRLVETIVEPPAFVDSEIPGAEFSGSEAHMKSDVGDPPALAARDGTVVQVIAEVAVGPVEHHRLFNSATGRTERYTASGDLIA